MLKLNKKHLRLNPITLSLIIIVFGTLLYYFDVHFLELMEKTTIDLRFVSRGDISHDSNVVIAAIDEKSVDQEGKWVWPRRSVPSGSER